MCPKCLIGGASPRSLLVIAVIPKIILRADKSCIVSSACVAVVDDDAAQVVRVGGVERQERLEGNVCGYLVRPLEDAVESPTLEV